jgi:aryl carrier-like protein
MTLPTGPIRRAFLRRTPPGRRLDPEMNFFEAGFTSAVLAAVLAELVEAGIPLRLIDLYRYPTLSALETEAASRSRTRSAPDRPTAPSRRALPWDT